MAEKPESEDNMSQTFQIRQGCKIEESMVTGRNGHFQIKEVAVWDGGNDKVFIDAVGKSGRTLNATLIIDRESFDSLIEQLNRRAK